MATICAPVRVGAKELCQDDSSPLETQHSGTMTPECSFVFGPKSAGRNSKFDPQADGIDGVEAVCMQLVPISDPSALSKGQKDSDTRATAVLQLVNKEGGNAFSFVDEYLLTTMVRHMAYAFEMAWCGTYLSELFVFWLRWILDMFFHLE